MILSGLTAAPVTTFKPNGDISPDKVSDYAALLKKQGVSGVFVNGTTGEGFSLTDDERRVMVEAWTAEKEDSFKVTVHIGHTSRRTSVKLAEHASSFDADAIGEMGPIFFKPSTVEELISYCSLTSSATDLPYYYYHMPAMNGLNFAMVDFLRSASGMLQNLLGIKYTDFNLTDYKACLDFSDEFEILFGRDEVLLDALKLGAKGAVGSTYNCAAPLYNEICRLFEDGDDQAALNLQEVSVEMIDALAEKGAFFSALRHALRLQGLETGEPRAPLKRLTIEDRIILEDKLTSLALFN